MSQDISEMSDDNLLEFASVISSSSKFRSEHVTFNKDICHYSFHVKKFMNRSYLYENLGNLWVI